MVNGNYFLNQIPFISVFILSLNGSEDLNYYFDLKFDEVTEDDQ